MKVTVIQRIGTRTGDHLNYIIVEIGQDTEKSSGDLRRLEETYCHSNSSEKPSANTDVKNSQKSCNNNDDDDDNNNIK